MSCSFRCPTPLEYPEVEQHLVAGGGAEQLTLTVSDCCCCDSLRCLSLLSLVLSLLPHRSLPVCLSTVVVTHPSPVSGDGRKISSPPEKNPIVQTCLQEHLSAHLCLAPPPASHRLLPPPPDSPQPSPWVRAAFCFLSFPTFFP